ncbi:MAG: hypothetical protein H6835_02860 [Planctomycetes bacterium]|nr:hypothetical protein [Planctomycetota bacterium]
MRRLLPLLLASAIASAAAIAQDPGDVRTLGRLRAAGLQKLAAQWPTTRLGRLFADPDVAPAAAKVLHVHAAEAARRRETIAAALSGRYELEPWLVSWISARRVDPTNMLDVDVAETDQVELLALMVVDQPFTMANVLARTCTPRHEGKWTQEFEAEAARLRASTALREVPDAKVDSFPAYLFTSPTEEDQEGFTNPSWMLHLPGRFVRITGNAPPGVLTQLSERAAPGLSITLDAAASMLQFEQQQRTPEEFLMLGFDKLSSLEWRSTFAGEHVIAEIVAVTEATPTGLVGAIVNGTAALPRQPLPDGALVQLRCALDLECLAAIAASMRLGLPPTMLAQLQKALTGGVALGICAPPPGGLIPRVHLSLGVADRAALDQLLAQIVDDELPHKTAEYEGVQCTVLQLPEVPNGLQPAFCVHDGALHFAESPRTLRKFLQLLGEGGDAMEVGDIAVPDGPGELLPTLDLRFDEAAVYRAYYDTWLPLLALTLGAGQLEMVLEKDDLPDPDTVDQHCGFGRGVLRRDGKRYLLQQQGTFGGIEALALTLLWGPLIAAQLHDNLTDNIAEGIAAQQLSKVQDALAAFQQREQRRPTDLAELFAAQRLAKDALLLPGDDLAEPLTLADGTTTRCSYRYFPETTPWDTTGDGTAAVLIEIRPHRYQRAVLTADGRVQQDYSNDSRKPIDAFAATGR